MVKLKGANQGLNLDDYGIFAAAFLDRFIRTHFAFSTTQKLKNVTQEEVDKLRSKLEADYISKSLFSSPPVAAIDLESSMELQRKKKKKANISSDSDGDRSSSQGNQLPAESNRNKIARASLSNKQNPSSSSRPQRARRVVRQKWFRSE